MRNVQQITRVTGIVLFEISLGILKKKQNKTSTGVFLSTHYSKSSKIETTLYEKVVNLLPNPVNLGH